MTEVIDLLVPLSVHADIMVDPRPAPPPTFMSRLFGAKPALPGLAEAEEIMAAAVAVHTTCPQTRSDPAVKAMIQPAAGTRPFAQVSGMAA